MNTISHLEESLEGVLAPNQIDPVKGLYAILEAASQSKELEVTVLSNDVLEVLVDGESRQIEAQYAWSKFRMLLSRFGRAMLMQKPDPNDSALFGFCDVYRHSSDGREYMFYVECANSGEGKPHLKLRTLGPQSVLES